MATLLQSFVSVYDLVSQRRRWFLMSEVTAGVKVTEGAFRDYFKRITSLLDNKNWIWIYDMTLSCVHSSSLLPCLVQEIKVGRSIQGSPLTLLPSYSTWNSTSPTEEASQRKRRPSVVNDYTKKKTQNLCACSYFLVTYISVLIYELGRQKNSLQESFWICSVSHIKCVKELCCLQFHCCWAEEQQIESWYIHAETSSVKCVQTRSDSQLWQ